MANGDEKFTKNAEEAGRALSGLPDYELELLGRPQNDTERVEYRTENPEFARIESVYRNLLGDSNLSLLALSILEKRRKGTYPNGDNHA